MLRVFVCLAAAACCFSCTGGNTVPLKIVVYPGWEGDWDVYELGYYRFALESAHSKMPVDILPASAAKPIVLDYYSNDPNSDPTDLDALAKQCEGRDCFFAQFMRMPGDIALLSVWKHNGGARDLLVLRNRSMPLMS